MVDQETELSGEPQWTLRTSRAALSYESISSDFDCSDSEGSSTLLPYHELITGMGLRWSGRRADFFDEFGQLAALATTDCRDTHTVLLTREDLVRRYLAQEDLVLCWVVT